MMKCRDKRDRECKGRKKSEEIFLIDEKRHKKSLENETKCDVNIH